MHVPGWVRVAGFSSHLERLRRLPIPIKHVAHVAVRAREHVAGVPAHGALELVEYAIVLVQVTKLRRRVLGASLEFSIVFTVLWRKTTSYYGVYTAQNTSF